MVNYRKGCVVLCFRGFDRALRRVRFALHMLAVTAVLAFSSQAAALGTSAEIDHLLSYIAASPCAFIRNGVAYGGAQAAAHIKDKYEYYRSEIHSTEDFIALAATRSALSGQLYLVQCEAAAVPAAEWLKKELTALRRRS